MWKSGGMDLHLVNHPLAADRLRSLRDHTTDTARFRDAMDSLGAMLCYEAFSGIEVTDVEVQTPLSVTTGKQVTDAPLFVPVLRAGLGLLEPAIRLVPSAQVGFFGLARDEQTHQPVTYLASLPEDLSDRQVVVLDPMLATAGSMVATVKALVERGARDIVCVCVLCAPEGVRVLEGVEHVASLYTAAIDDHLDENAFIVPGLGDAGDRLYGPR